MGQHHMTNTILILKSYYWISTSIAWNVCLYCMELSRCVIVTAVFARGVAGGVGVPVR